MTSTPQPAGTWSEQADASHDFLRAGRRYRVTSAFVDYDRDLHPVGETWFFLGASFLPYDDGVSLFVSFDEGQEWQIRLQWRPEEQGHILDALADYLAEL